MWKWAVFNGLLFWIVSYLGTKNHIHAVTLAVIFGVVHYVLGKHLRPMIEGFDYMPNTKEVPPCPVGMDRAANGLDCKSKGDRYGL
jgi:hypothetical protein